MSSLAREIRLQLERSGAIPVAVDPIPRAEKLVTFSLDYDNTYSADRILWRAWIAAALLRGHTIYCVTGRTADQANISALASDLPPEVIVICCDHKPKRAVCEAKGIAIDIWIDDFPEGIPTEAAGRS